MASTPELDKLHGLVTIQQHILDHQRRYHPTASGEFSWLLAGIMQAGKIIASYVRRAGLVNIWGALEGEGVAGQTNVQGEVVQKLDQIANETLKKMLGYRGNVGIVASEEDAEPRVLQELTTTGKYIVLFDPLDGSSNIDTNVSIGTIFSVLHRPQWERNVSESILQPGIQQLAAGYVCYGSATTLVYTVGEGVHMFTLDPGFGSFFLVKENIKMPSYAPHYSVNEAYAPYFPEPYQKYLDWCKTEPGGKCSSRYVGSMVADFHRILLKGGVFMYPPTQKSPEGKLRLMYEAKPLAMVAEQAGGLCTDGATRMLEKRPEALHERTPVIIGSRRNVEDLHKFIDGREHLALGPAEPKAEKALAQKAAEPSSESAPA